MQQLLDSGADVHVQEQVSALDTLECPLVCDNHIQQPSSLISYARHNVVSLIKISESINSPYNNTAVPNKCIFVTLCMCQ